MLCEALERRLLLTAATEELALLNGSDPISLPAESGASLERLFAHSNVGEPSAHRAIVPGELIVGYQRASDQVDGTDGAVTLTAHVGHSLEMESSVFVKPLFQIGASFEKTVDLYHLRFDASTDLLELATSTMALPGVAWVAPNYQYSGDLTEFVPDDPLYGSQYHHDLIGSESAWDVTLGYPSVTIAILDDGVETLHPDLNPNIWRNAAELLGTAGVDDDNNGFVDDFIGWGLRRWRQQSKPT